MSDEHGSIAAYRRHKRAGETPCDACLAASAAYARERRAAKKLAANETRREAPAARAVPRPSGMPSDAYRPDPMRETTPEEDEIEVPGPKRVVRAPEPIAAPEEPLEPPAHRVVGATIARGRIIEQDPRYATPELELEEIPAAHPAATQETWIGTIESRADRRRRRLPWARRR